MKMQTLDIEFFFETSIYGWVFVWRRPLRQLRLHIFRAWHTRIGTTTTTHRQIEPITCTQHTAVSGNLSHGC